MCGWRSFKLNLPVWPPYRRFSLPFWMSFCCSSSSVSSLRTIVSIDCCILITMRPCRISPIGRTAALLAPAWRINFESELALRFMQF